MRSIGVLKNGGLKAAYAYGLRRLQKKNAGNSFPGVLQFSL
jgi:hypothetical protein